MGASTADDVSAGSSTASSAKSISPTSGVAAGSTTYCGGVGWGVGVASERGPVVQGCPHEIDDLPAVGVGGERGDVGNEFALAVEPRRLDVTRERSRADRVGIPDERDDAKLVALGLDERDGAGDFFDREPVAVVAADDFGPRSGIASKRLDKCRGGRMQGGTRARRHLISQPGSPRSRHSPRASPILPWAGRGR